MKLIKASLFEMRTEMTKAQLIDDAKLELSAEVQKMK
jgi:hypothetical protein